MSGPAKERVYLSIGGNIGEPRKTMAAALRLLDADPQTQVIKVSSLYRTPPWGRLDQPDFLNAAAQIATGRSPRELLELCLETERKLKRVREERWGPRVVDIDILMIGARSIHETDLDVPHPRMLDRAFVLVPLAEIAPDFQVRGASLADHLEVIDRSGIEKQPSGQDWWKD